MKRIRSLALTCGLLLAGAAGLAQSPRDQALLHYEVALRAIKDGHLRVAAGELATARALDPQNALVHYTLAVVHKERDPGEASKALERALQLGLPEPQRASSADLRVEIHYRLARQRAAETFTDPATGLMWTAKDNGDDIGAAAAGRYCTALRLGGFDDWRLPTIAELEQVSDRSVIATNKIKPPLKLSGCCPWSSSKQGRAGVVFAFNFGQPWPYEGTLNCRVLCVRIPGDQR